MKLDFGWVWFSLAAWSILGELDKLDTIICKFKDLNLSLYFMNITIQYVDHLKQSFT